MEIKLDPTIEDIINQIYKIDSSILREIEQRNQLAEAGRSSYVNTLNNAPKKIEEPVDTDSTIKNIEQNLKYELELKTRELNGILDLLAQVDLKIDKVDVEIENIEKQSLTLINEINTAINQIKEAYEQRIAAGCLSDLIWENNGELNSNYNPENPITVKNYKVVKNPEQKQEINYYGIKYYQKPLNRDYGFTIVLDFNGSIKSESNNLAVLTPDIIENIQIGDQIADNVSEPQLFGSNIFPAVIGIGTTQVLGITTSNYASISIGSSILAITGTGTTENILIGNYVVNPNLFSENTQIIGFGTTVVSISYASANPSGFITTDITVSSAILNKNAIGLATDALIGIGTYSSYPSIILDANSTYELNDFQFTLIRTTGNIEDDFDYTKSPLDPVKIAISNSVQIGLGHSSVLINNGASSIPVNWREVLQEPEPVVGNEKAIYYVGISSWPYNPEIGYAEEGKIYRFSGDSSAIYTGVSPVFGFDPQNNSECVSLASSITAAQNNLEVVKQRNLSKIQQLIIAANSLRKARDKQEQIAWAYLQSSSYIRKDIYDLTNQINSITSIDYESL